MNRCRNSDAETENDRKQAALDAKAILERPAKLQSIAEFAEQAMGDRELAQMALAGTEIDAEQAEFLSQLYNALLPEVQKIFLQKFSAQLEAFAAERV